MRGVLRPTSAMCGPGGGYASLDVQKLICTHMLGGLPGRNHKVTCAGAMVSLTTPTSSLLRACRFVSSPELCRERFEDLSGVVLCSVEAAVYEGLDAPSQGSEEGGDRRVEATTTSCGSCCWPVMVRKRAWVVVTPPKYTSASVPVSEP